MRSHNRREEPSIRERSGFTLIELLIVLAVVALLAALLFPVFNIARGKAKMTACASNLHQLHVACSLYAADYDSYLPAHPSRGTVFHINGVETFVEQSRKLVACMQPYIRSQAVWLCPADSEPYNPDPGRGIYPRPHVTSYWYAGFGTNRDRPIYPVRIDQPDLPNFALRPPARADLLYDDVSRPCDANYTDYNHNGRCNHMYYDGHLKNELFLYECP